MPDQAMWNDILDFLNRMFPDNSGPWTVREIVRAAEGAFDHPDDPKVSRDRVYAAIERLVAHGAEFPKTAHQLERHFTGDCYYYSAASARMILKEAARGALPKNFRASRHAHPTQSPHPP